MNQTKVIDCIENIFKEYFLSSFIKLNKVRSLCKNDLPNCYVCKKVSKGLEVTILSSLCLPLCRKAVVYRLIADVKQICFRPLKNYVRIIIRKTLYSIQKCILTL